MANGPPSINGPNHHTLSNSQNDAQGSQRVRLRRVGRSNEKIRSLGTNLYADGPTPEYSRYANRPVVEQIRKTKPASTSVKEKSDTELPSSSLQPAVKEKAISPQPARPRSASFTEKTPTPPLKGLDKEQRSESVKIPQPIEFATNDLIAKRVKERRVSLNLPKSASDPQDAAASPTSVMNTLFSPKNYHLKLFQGLYMHQGLEKVKKYMPAEEKLSITAHSVLTGILKGEGLEQTAAVAQSKESMQFEPSYMLLKHFINRGVIFFDKLAASYISHQNKWINRDERNEEKRKHKKDAIKERVKMAKKQLANELFNVIFTEEQLTNYVDGTVPKDLQPMSRENAIMRWWDGALTSPFTHSCEAYFKTIKPDLVRKKDVLSVYKKFQITKEDVIRDSIDVANGECSTPIKTANGDLLTAGLLELIVGRMFNRIISELSSDETKTAFREFLI